MTLHISSVFTYDEDAGNYIQAVETADGQALESATRKAINDFVIGCKQDGIWDAIKASCILAGARTLAGALVPLVGTAPTNYNFVAGDYNRKTGLVGDGSTKYLNSNRANNADPKEDHHLALHATFVEDRAESRMGSVSASGIVSANDMTSFAGNLYLNLRGPASGVTSSYYVVGAQTITGFAGAIRNPGSIFQHRVGGITRGPFSGTAQTPHAYSQYVFARNLNGSPTIFSTARIAFYSIGESLDLAKLDGRVTDLINKFSEVIP